MLRVKSLWLTTLKGLATGGWVRAVTTTAETFGETFYTLYDAKGRAVRTHTDTYLGGFTETDTRLDFDGTALYTLTRHRRTAADTPLEVREDFTYTPQDRLQTHTHTIGASQAQLLAFNEYNALGELTVKKVGGTDLTGFASFQKVDYTYNIRGWLTGINKIAGLSAAGAPQDFFAFAINYNEPVAENINGQVVPLYNGNIAETTWRTSADNVVRRYGYSYDALNRMTAAWYQKPGNTVSVTSSYNENLRYDKNGNITALQRTGEYDDAIYNLMIDDLSYTYDPVKKNRLMRVTDATNFPKGFKDSPDNDEDDYAYVV